MFPQSRAADDAFIRGGMSPIELRRLGELIVQEQPSLVLEVGMAHGTSSVVIAEALLQTSGGHLTSIDPNQSLPTPIGYNGAGRQVVQRITAQHRIIEEYDFLALPHLIEQGETFDLILIDGFHSFDLTLLDLFYADKLLAVGCVLVCHDSSSPAVFKALRWLEENKPYQRLSPPLYTAEFSFARKVYNRLFRQSDRRERQTHWQMLMAYRKQAEHHMPEHTLTDF